MFPGCYFYCCIAAVGYLVTCNSAPYCPGVWPCDKFALKNNSTFIVFTLINQTVTALLKIHYLKELSTECKGRGRFCPCTGDICLKRRLAHAMEIHEDENTHRRRSLERLPHLLSRGNASNQPGRQSLGSERLVSTAALLFCR